MLFMLGYVILDEGSLIVYEQIRKTEDKIIKQKEVTELKAINNLVKQYTKEIGSIFNKRSAFAFSAEPNNDREVTE